MAEAVLYCANHPDRETSLRCNRCEKPICSSCAVLTPTGYRCQECVRGQQKIFNTAKAQDYVFAFLVAGVLSYIGALLSSRIGFFTILLAPAAGSVIAEAVRRVVQKRRSRTLYQIATGGVVLGALPFMVFPLLFVFSGGGLRGLLSLLWPALYLSITASTFYYRLSGISITR